MERVRVVVSGVDMRRKKVMPSGNSGRVYVPKEWIGAEVAIVLVPVERPPPAATRDAAEA